MVSRTKYSNYTCHICVKGDNYLFMNYRCSIFITWQCSTCASGSLGFVCTFVFTLLQLVLVCANLVCNIHGCLCQHDFNKKDFHTWFFKVILFKKWWFYNKLTSIKHGKQQEVNIKTVKVNKTFKHLPVTNDQTTLDSFVLFVNDWSSTNLKIVRNHNRFITKVSHLHTSTCSNGQRNVYITLFESNWNP